jgi:hypothetical protein
MASLKNTVIDDTAALQLPAGTTTQRPAAPEPGQTRYNTNFNQLETYNGSRWAYLPDIVTESLVCRLDAGEPSSYPGTGNIWFDISGAGRNFTLAGSYSYSQNDLSLIFAGGETASRANFWGDAITTIAPSSAGNASADATLEAWVYPTTLDATARHLWTDGNFNEGEVEFYNNQIRAHWGDSNTILYSQSIPANRWYHVVHTHLRDSLTDLYKNVLYINGIRVGATAATRASTSATSYGPDGTCNFGYQFIGRLSTFSTYDRCLSHQEIQRNYNALRSRYGV